MKKWVGLFLLAVGALCVGCERGEEQETDKEIHFGPSPSDGMAQQADQGCCCQH